MIKYGVIIRNIEEKDIPSVVDIQIVGFCGYVVVDSESMLVRYG